jgi:membrane fusion protein
MTSLFRPEVAAKRGNRLSGEVLLATPLSTGVIVALRSALVVIVALVGGMGSYAAYETVQGRLVPNKGLITVASN